MSVDRTPRLEPATGECKRGDGAYHNEKKADDDTSTKLCAEAEAKVRLYVHECGVSP
jgi:hypothetical protein